MSGKIVAFDLYTFEDSWRDVGQLRASSLKDLLATPDRVTLHVPLTESTRGGIGAEQHSQMKGERYPNQRIAWRHRR